MLDDFGDNRLTLTACHPKYSARQRIVVVAALVGEAAPAPTTAAAGGPPTTPATTPTSVRTPDDRCRPRRRAGLGLAGDHAGLACALIWIAAWLLGKLWQKWPAYLVGLPVFLVVLFFFFENFSRLLPANF